MQISQNHHNCAGHLHCGQDYLNEMNIPISNIMSTAADGAPTIMGRRNGVLILLKYENPDMIVHSVIHLENLVAGALSPEYKSAPQTRDCSKFFVIIWTRIR